MSALTNTRPDNCPAAWPLADDDADLDPGDPELDWILVQDAIGDDAFYDWVIDTRGLYGPLEGPPHSRFDGRP
jgi:hypothetical protein